MEASDFMAGDWVYNSKNERCKICSIEGIGEPYATLDNYDKENDGCFETECDLNPIPLVADILEKNGFVHRQSVTWGDIFTYTYAIIQKDKVLQYEQHFNLSPHPYDGSGFYWIPEMSAVSALLVVYVHELQHLLRLCGIDKEINL